MNYRIAQLSGTKYLELYSCKTPLKTQQDALELLALCGEHGLNRLMIHSEALSEDFFSLKTGTAGALLQKFINYVVKTAVVLPDRSRLGARFRELMSETDRGGDYRFFTSSTEAEKWFLKEA